MACMYFIISAGVIRGIEFREGVLKVEVKKILAGFNEGSLGLGFWLVKWQLRFQLLLSDQMRVVDRLILWLVRYPLACYL